VQVKLIRVVCSLSHIQVHLLVNSPPLLFICANILFWHISEISAAGIFIIICAFSPLMLRTQDVDEVEFQQRRHELIAVQRSEAHKMRHRLELDQQKQELDTSHTADDTDSLVC